MKHQLQTKLKSAPERAALLQQASAPETPPPELLALSRLGDKEINALIAANPNTPKKTLYALWRVHPLRAMENPIISFWSLREGKPFHDLLPFEVKLSLYMTLRKTEAVDKIEEHLPENERCRWLDQGDGWLAFDSDEQSAAPRRLERRDPDAEQDGKRISLKEAFELLAEDPSPQVRQAVAGSIDSLPIGNDVQMRLQERLAKDNCPEVRARVASSRIIDPSTHLLLSRDAQLTVRRCLAKNRLVPGNISDEGWNNLVDVGLVAEVAGNPSCPDSVKLQLVNRTSREERIQAWANLQFHLLTKWDAVHAAIETAISTPERTAEVVQIARNRSISGTIRRSLIEHKEVRVTRALATQSHLTEQELLKLLYHPDPGTALRAAKHAPPVDSLVAAAAHPNPMVRALLAKKKGYKMWSLRNKLVDDPDPRVRLTLCRTLMKHGDELPASDSMVMAAIQKLRNDSCPKVRKLARTHPRHGKSNLFDTLIGGIGNLIASGKGPRKNASA